jgi:hypothetical protein
MTEPIRIEGIEPLLRKLKSIDDLKPVKAAIKAAALHIKGKIAVYPSSSIANSETQGRWYERGYGPKWRRKDGSVGGRKTSETLGRRWTIQIKNSGLTAIVGNNTSYGPYVQSAEKQAKFHGLRDWKTDEQVLDEERDTVTNFVLGYIQRELDK